jgi:hypothetical protein
MPKPCLVKNGVEQVKTKVAPQVTTITAVETRRRKAAIESDLKELLGSSPER